MIDNLKFWAKAAVADRKGATALEYALIASALAAVTMVGFRTFFQKINTHLEGIPLT